MKIINYILTLVIVLLVVTCTKPYTIKFDDIEKRIVVSSFFNSDSLMMIKVVEEASLSDNIKSDFKTIDSALAIIYANNTIIDTAKYTNNGIYYSNFIPNENIIYKINIKKRGFSDATAEDKIPELIKIDTLIRLNNNDEYYNYRIKISFHDPASINNYYLFSVFWLAHYEDMTWWSEANYRTNDPSIGDWLDNSFQVPIFNDELFNGMKYELAFDLHVEDRESSFERGYCYVNLYSISKNMYLYLRSYNQQTPRFGDHLLEDFQQGLMNPIPIYTNVEGGLGIFAGCAVSQDSVLFE
ncbi:MAG: DUF4249 domain-containing protein [Bacteroidales bacterium]|nr:DUF4249 domain-containing protein [Bacteroidales bacterium]